MDGTLWKRGNKIYFYSAIYYNTENQEQLHVHGTTKK